MSDFPTPHTSFSDRRILSGFDELDGALGGWYPGQLVVVGGRNWNRDTNLALDFAMAAARANLPAAILGLHLTADEIDERLLLASTSIRSHHLKDGDLTEWEHELIQAAKAERDRIPLIISKKRMAYPDDLLAHVRSLYQRHHLRLLVIESFDLLTAWDHPAEEEEGNAELGRSWKTLARELDIPIVVGVRLKENEERPYRRAVFGDLSPIGQLDLFVDSVIFIHSTTMPEYDLPGGLPEIVEVAVEKNSQGPTGSTYMVYQPAVCRFDSLPVRRPALPGQGN